MRYARLLFSVIKEQSTSSSIHEGSPNFQNSFLKITKYEQYSWLLQGKVYNHFGFGKSYS